MKVVKVAKGARGSKGAKADKRQRAVVRAAPPVFSDKREAILAAALVLFGTKGFDGTPVPEIAGAAGVAAGTIYRYFASKEALVNDLYRTWKRRFYARLAEGYPVGGSPRAQLAHLWGALTKFSGEAPAAFQFLEAHFHAPYLDGESVALSEEVMGFAAGFAAAGSAAGALKELDPRLLIGFVFGAFVNVWRISMRGDLADLGGARALAAAEICAWDAVRR